MTLGSGAPLSVAWSGAASSCRKPSTSPSSALSSIGCTQRSKLPSWGATIDDGHRVERALEDRLDAAGVVDLQRGPWAPKQVR